ncbi:MAG TPA: cysteine hydrolase [Candidatus Limnocylindria bacterium]|nr:cysteine hydrolase [Candidatus Limnocylindria bacterium]
MAELTLDPDRAALCVVEMQNDIVHESKIGTRGLGGVLAAAVHERGVIARLANLMAAARRRGVPVVYVNFALKPGFPRPNTLLHRRSQREPTLIEGTWGAEIHPALAATPQDFVLERTVGVDGSYGTQLYPVLRQLRRTTMLMTGVSTNIAIESIVRASVNRGFDMVVIEDCCASYPDDWHRFSIENIMPLLATVTSADAVLRALEAPAGAPAA